MTEPTTEPKRKLPLRSAFAVVLAIVAALAAPLSAEAYQSQDAYVSNGHGYLNAQYLVIHETANPGASAWNHVQYWRGNDTYAVHHVMELDGSTVYNTVPENRLCWHVGNGNVYTIGIELAHATNAADFAKQWNEAVKWTGDEVAPTTLTLTAISVSTARRGTSSSRLSLLTSVLAMWLPSRRPTATAARTSPQPLPPARVSRSPRARA